MKKLVLAIIVLCLSIFSAACSSQSTAKAKDVTVKIGISGSDNGIWDYISKKAKKEGINIKIVSFSDYVLPNTALADGEIDANAFQTNAYFFAFIKEHNLDLAPIGTTVIAPMGIYSNKHKDVKDIPDGGKIAVPNDVTNEGRALLLLQEAGLITLPKDFDGSGTVEQIISNPKHLKIVPVVAGQTPRVLPDVAASIINNGIAVDAGFNPVKDSIFHEGATAKPYINIIATRTKDKNNKALKEIVKLYQQKDTAEFIKKQFKGALIPTFVPLSEIGVKN
ncbi:MetQ/NlpA family ABC transporter substrate-binding protein [Neobacillus sp. PS3-40]|uniref:MetQ/NlpA family ABC transporter substrate-binding protein n=1 Tax=Neobacillus sp. PS3-40 TaxID=3070679 RepID=UPI0027DF5D82|nr:MetQ/NlpA family ABC transporter substrate-binding protein [Neobacillus sp. PS3-40]WML42942.1 MetQ/NlpA family ABC transporter substrate-binding protein [Neobacillus sp. PS3-40]